MVNEMVKTKVAHGQIWKWNLLKKLNKGGKLYERVKSM